LADSREPASETRILEIRLERADEMMQTRASGYARDLEGDSGTWGNRYAGLGRTREGRGGTREKDTGRMKKPQEGNAGQAKSVQR